MNQSSYFISRASVGQKFAAELAHLRYENTAILALSKGGVVMGIEIAKRLHSITGMLLLKDVDIPGGEKLGAISERGLFTYDDSISAAAIEEYESEYRGSIETDKMNAVHDLHAIGHEGSLDPHYFSGRHVIIITDFAMTGTAFHAANEFLKPIVTEKIIMAAAVAKTAAIDTMHHLSDQILVAHATDQDFPPEHYFANNEIPESKEIVQLMEQIVLQW